VKRVTPRAPGRSVRALAALLLAAALPACGQTPVEMDPGDPQPGPDEGVLRIMVAGLEASATSGGSADVAPTGDTPGSPVTIDVDADGVGQTALLAGTYEVAYAPPTGYELADGESGTADVTVTVGGDTRVDVSVSRELVPNPPPPPPPGAVLIEEGFEDANFGARGWYDSRSPIITTDESIPGSQSALELHFNQGSMSVTGSPGRHLFQETDVVVLSYWVKYSANWVGSARSVHPHEFYFLTNKDGEFVGPAAAYLEVLVEQNHNRVDGMVPWIGIRGEIFAGSETFTDAPGPNYKNDWHFIEAMIQMNSAPGVADGIVRYWFDGRLVTDETDVLIRTEPDDADMRFNQMLIGPFINGGGAGSPVDQTMWVDDLRLATAR
jgi:hypothetical protein